ncbi:hypothetical protein F7725_028783 [Dissostichus mawsoni]|uniref:Uncharacterized protein n=1 Tax=Dissostichus mawsoni TaxID=36200 RepID=A0A7J5XGM3_DISMA|nr:hypothetical protein F7725_028783 [Dissostichus mawsoni]
MIKPGKSGLPGSCQSKSSGSAPKCQKLFTRAQTDSLSELKATLLSDVQFNFNCHITTPPTNTKLSSLYSALHQFAALLTTMPAGPDLDDLIKLYFRLSLSNKEILAILAHTNHIVISV